MARYFLALALTASLLATVAWVASVSRRLRRMEKTRKTDALTGVGSCYWLETDRWDAAICTGLPLAVCYFFLLQLGAERDRRGRSGADRYLASAAASVRHCAAAGRDEVFRSPEAGAHLIMLVHGEVEPRELAQAIVNQLRDAGFPVGLGMFYSTTTDPAGRQDGRALAFAACHQAAGAGKPGFVLHDPSTPSAAADRGAALDESRAP